MDEFGDSLSWIGEHWPTIVTLIFSGAVAWSAIVGNRLNTRLVEAEIDPAMSVYLEPNLIAFRYFDLVVKNVGRGSARNVSFHVNPIQPQHGSKIITDLNELGIVRTGLPFLAPEQELRFVIGNYQELESLGLEMSVRYSRDSGSKESRAEVVTFPLDVRPYEGMRTIGEHPEQVTAKALKDISTTLKRVKTADAIRVRMEREYLFGPRLDYWRFRWFGDYVTNRDGGPLKYFVKQLRAFANRQTMKLK